MTTTLQSTVLDAYRRHFGSEPEQVVRAPGRVNLIGEHTDYNDGFVLPMAIDRETLVAIGPATDGQVRSVAVDFDAGRDQFDAHRPIVRTDAEWANYVRGVTRALIEEGLPPPAVRMAIAGDVPLGSGLSSSAALEIAVGLALSHAAQHPLDPTRLAQLAQRAENDFVGCACGIMDQLISARGIAGHALMIDCRSLGCTPVPMPADWRVVIVHSGVRHAHAGGEYNDRRAQCDAAAAHYGVAALRDLSPDRLEGERAGLEPVAYARARHVVHENARVIAATQALRAADLCALGVLLDQSHASMRDDFAITVPAVDRLQAIMARAVDGRGGARMTGGGFGGCVIALTDVAGAVAVEAAVASAYRTPGGALADVFQCVPAAGASVVANRATGPDAG